MALGLLSVVGRALDDDGARLVLADRLSELGDPQGEFISIQVSSGGARAKGLARLRERELLHLFRPTWVPLGAEPSTAVFRRGLLQSCTWFGPTDPRHRGWLTVERLTCFGFQAAGPQQSPFGASPLPALRTVSGARESTFLAMARCGLPNLEWLSLNMSPRSFLALAAELRVFSRLHTLHLNSAVEPDAQLAPLLEALGEALEGKVAQVRLFLRGRLSLLPAIPRRALRIEVADPSGAVAVL